MLDLSQNLYVEDFNFNETESLRTSTLRGDVPTSDEISGIEIRLSKVYISDNKTNQWGPFPGLANIYFLNIVASDISAAQTDVNLNGFEKVDDKDTLAVDKTLFFWKKTKTSPKPPSQIHIMSSLIKSKKALRDTAAIMAEAQNDDKFKGLSSELGTLLKSTSSVGNISNIIFQLGGIVGGLLGKVEDKPLLTRYQSFTDIGGNFNQLGKTDNPFSNRYAEVDYTIYIRDKERQKEAEKNS